MSALGISATQQRVRSSDLRPGFRPFTRQPQSSELRDLEKSRGQLQPLSSVAAVRGIAGRLKRCRARQKCRAKDDKDVRSRWPPSYSLHVIRLLRCPSAISRGIQFATLDWQPSQDYVAADLLPAELILQGKPLFHVPCNGDCSLTVHLRVHGKIAA